MSFALKLDVVEKKGVEGDTLLKLRLTEEEGGRNTVVAMTLHGIQPDGVDVKSKGMVVTNSDGASVQVNFQKPVGTSL